MNTNVAIEAAPRAAATPRPLSLLEKIGYSCGDAAANFVFMSMVLFQTNFYTDVFGITASAAAAVLLIARAWDALVDPVVGYLADRTRTRWGKFRPWILATALPWAVLMVLTYTTPSGISTRDAHLLCDRHERSAHVRILHEQHAVRGARERNYLGCG